MDKFMKKFQKLDKLDNYEKNDKIDKYYNDDKEPKGDDKNIIDNEDYDININDINLIKNCFEYYDKNQEKNKNKFALVNYISLQTSEKDLEHNVMIFYDSDFKELFRSRIEKIGIYDKKSHIWSWAWSVAYLKKNETNIIRKILLYGIELDNNSRVLKTELVTSRFEISNYAQIDLHCAIASYLSKKPNIFKYNITSSPEIIENKYVNILTPDKSYDVNNKTFELEYYNFLLDEF
jgi:hypothetical protein